MPSASNANEPANRPRRGKLSLRHGGSSVPGWLAGAAAFSIGHDNPEVNAAIASQLTQVGDYLGGRATRRFAGTTLRCLVTGFLVSAASNNCRNPCANSPTAFPKAPSCPTRTIATDRCRSNDGGRNTFTGSIE